MCGYVQLRARSTEASKPREVHVELVLPDEVALVAGQIYTRWVRVRMRWNRVRMGWDGADIGRDRVTEGCTLEERKEQARCVV